jgi:dTDP-4-dehydrorhamnose 3,5-epimerase
LKFDRVAVEGAYLIRPERLADERGFFSRTYCARELAEHGLDPTIVQRSVSHNRQRGTLRGLHFQAAPNEENKLVSCIRGSIYDVIVDLRRGSSSYLRWLGVTLTPDEGTILYVPQGCAHGFLTLVDDSVVQYEISEFYDPAASRGVRYDDPAFGISWPAPPTVINARDNSYPPYAV